MSTEPKDLVEDENKIGTVIAGDIDFRGRLCFKDSLKIKGNFQGKVETTGHLIIGQEASVSADIKAGTVFVDGRVNGKITAHKRIELYDHSSVMGDIVTPELYTERGARFNGTCIMDGESSKAE